VQNNYPQAYFKNFLLLPSLGHFKADELKGEKTYPVLINSNNNEDVKTN
jgi:hypothetical protein